MTTIFTLSQAMKWEIVPTEWGIIFAFFAVAMLVVVQAQLIRMAIYLVNRFLARYPGKASVREIALSQANYIVLNCTILRLVIWAALFAASWSMLPATYGRERLAFEGVRWIWMYLPFFIDPFLVAKMLRTSMTRALAVNTVAYVAAIIIIFVVIHLVLFLFPIAKDGLAELP